MVTQPSDSGVDESSENDIQQPVDQGDRTVDSDQLKAVNDGSFIDVAKDDTGRVSLDELNRLQSFAENMVRTLVQNLKPGDSYNVDVNNADRVSIGASTVSNGESIELPTVLSAVSPKTTHDAPRIFISYKRTDWDRYVYPLVVRLKAEGFSVWVDQHLLEGGDDWMDEINKALKDCSYMLLCVSPEALESRHVKMEYRYFFNTNKKIFPLICRGADLPAELQTIQYHPYEKIDDLIAILKKHCLVM